MARTKSRVVTADMLPENLKVKAGPAMGPALTMETASESPSSFTTSSTCPNCSISFPEMTPTHFQDHVASCTRPSTADDDSEKGNNSDRSLTPPPDSPSILILKIGKKLAAEIPIDNSLQLPSGAANETLAKDVSATIESDDEVNNKVIHAYDPTDVDYYDKVDDREGSVATRQNSEEAHPKASSTGNPDGSSEEKSVEAKVRFPFRKFTSIDTFEDFMANLEDASYENLYHRAEQVANVLVDYQKEWDNIEKEIYIHESYVKAQARKMAEAAKIAEEEKAKVEDVKYLELAQIHKVQLKLSRNEWEQFLENDFDSKDPKQMDVVERLRNLRQPHTLSAIHKRQKAREPEPRVSLVDRPLLQDRVTKEEIALDKRKRGRLIEHITFEDMKQADAYGFNYSAQAHHVGNQPQPTYNGKLKARGDADEGRSRSQRNKAQKSYDTEKSLTPETENDELPAKRMRKPRITLDIGLETQPRGRVTPYSRGGTPSLPAPRTFPSGKRVGRPPRESKLKDFQVPPLSASPALENGGGPRKLAPREEEQLHDAAESLINRTRRPGHPANGELDYLESPSAEQSRPTSSSSAEGSRKRKRVPPPIEADTMRAKQIPSAILPPHSIPSPATDTTTKGRKRKQKEAEVDESTLTAAEVEALRKKRIKSAKLSESLRKRWANGEMAGAMETRKATNANKKAAKAGSSAGGSFATTPAIVPPITPNQAPPMKSIQPQPQLSPQPVSIIPTPVETPVAKRQRSALKLNTQSSQASQTSQTSQLSAEKLSSKGKKRAIPPPVTVRQLSTRARRPTRAVMGLDGADEEDEEENDELEQQFKSEYDHYQALTSPRSPVVLGKRVRKPKFDLAQVMDDSMDVDEDDF
ncbi:hypothetical protein BJ875DRAFT_497046 [Amylocarpus encephaloides]|uniref:Uncharacterized protein n=1 Tax=Amylocarpus encephaloides TaxID=45428 RepID=A0A9P7YFG6_9HELO|nr:hypothetical protein BJ875DRAFT_497046 [Amylocarpus encephaloides]